MRLTAADYKHPSELPSFFAGTGLALTLLIAVEALLLWLAIAAPIAPTVSRTVGIVLLVLLNIGGIAGFVRTRAYHRSLRASGRPVGPTRMARVHEASEEVARRLGLPATPPIYVLPMDNIDSFSLGLKTREVFITEGLVEQLDDLELRAALAHEFAHLRGGHVGVLTLVWTPLRARLLHPVLLGPQSLARMAMQSWLRAAELSADRAAAIATRGMEPVAHWLSAEVADPEEPGLDLHRYLSYLSQEQWRAAAEELRRSWPEVGARIAELARFVHSRKFARCLAIVGDLQIAPPEADDPAAAGVMPWVAIGLLAGIWLAPLTIAITLALGEPQVPTTTPTTDSRRFDPEMIEDYGVPPEDAGARNPFASREREEEPADQADAADTLPRLEDTGPVTATEEGLLELARQHKDRGEYDKAKRALDDLLVRNPTIAEAHYLMAWVAVELGERERALAEFQATVNLTEPDTQMHQEAAQALERME